MLAKLLLKSRAMLKLSIDRIFSDVISEVRDVMDVSFLQIVFKTLLQKINFSFIFCSIIFFLFLATVILYISSTVFLLASKYYLT